MRNLLALAMLLLMALPSNAYYDDYLPAGLPGKLKPLALKPVALDFSGDWKQEVMKGVTASNSDDGFVISGTDKAGNKWSLKDEDSHGLGGSCYIADLDKNGVEDIIFWFATGSCGLPFSLVQIIFFDKESRPHKEEVISRFDNPEKDRIRDLFIYGKDDDRYLLVQDLTYGKSAGRDLSYWRWSLLKAENCRLVEQKTALGMHFPCYVWFTNKPNHLLSKHAKELEDLYRK